MSSMTGLEPRSLIDALPSGLLAELTAADRGSWQSIREQASRELSSSDTAPRKQFALNYALLHTYRDAIDDEAVRHALQLISLAESLNDNKLRSVAHSEMGELYRSMGMFDRAVRHLRESLRHASSTDSRQLALPFLRLGLAYHATGESAEGLLRLERARNLFLAHNHPGLAAQALLGEARALIGLSRAQEALQRLESAENLILKTEDRQQLTAVHRAMAAAHAALGEEEQVAESLSLAAALHDQGIDSQSEGQTNLDLATFNFEQGRNEAALARLRTALHRFRESDDLNGMARVLRLMAAVHEAMDDTTAALGALKEHLQLRQKLEAREGDRRSAVRIMQLEQSLAHEHSSARRTHQALLEANRRLREQSAQLDLMSRTDYLTGLFNRRHLTQLLERELQSGSAGMPVTLLLLDIDEFKQVNDTYGHLAGDQVLRQVADLLKEHAADDSRVAARWGGEEFAIALFGGGLFDGEQLAQRLRQQIASESWAGVAPGLSISISVGIATVSELTGRSVRQLINLADGRLLDAKEQGRDQVISGG